MLLDTCQVPKNLFKIYIFQVAVAKLFLGATAWQFTAITMDNLYQNESNNIPMYILRCFIVGIIDSFFCCFGAFLATLIEKINKDSCMNIVRKDAYSILKLWISALVVGFFWQLETDFANFLASFNNGFKLVSSPEYSVCEIISNLFIFIFIHTLLFFLASRAVNASWAEYIIDLQVGFGGFGFYLANKLLFFSNKSSIVISLNAGLWTTIAAIIIGIPPIINSWYIRKYVNPVLFEYEDYHDYYHPINDEENDEENNDVFENNVFVVGLIPNARLL